ncbi:hypothetical protein BDW71DRAFT_178132 [Aspergillus fruticulosus]
MSNNIPVKCTVLVVGGGPGGAYTASVLAREGIDTVVLEADTFPRYHIGESMLPSFRHYLKFIDLDGAFDGYGFTKKVGAAFKMNPVNREGWTDFLAAGGPNNYSWNVIRSESDELLFRHAGKSGAAIFDGVKVTDIQFASSNGHSNGTVNGNANGTLPNPGRAVSATYVCKADGTTGTIQFDYLVDASGRAGLINTKYLKNRHYNTALKNVANWAYYRNAGRYGDGTKRANSPFFEALHDESGWAWFIPLHDGTTSVGVVRNQTIATEKKAAAPNMETYFDDALKLAPMLSELLHQTSTATRVTPIKSASDYSYHAASYSTPYTRTVGDAGCFIDPFFSSGVHLALTGGLAAATTIAASIRGDVDEETAARWHTAKVKEGYARFLLVVLSAYKQMLHQEEPVLSEFGEGNFDRAFTFFKPVIQGTVDTTNNAITQAEFSKTIDFLTKAFSPKVFDDGIATEVGKEGQTASLRDGLTSEDLEALTALRASHGATTMGIGAFTTDVVEGRVPRLERGALTLVLAESA